MRRYYQSRVAAEEAASSAWTTTSRKGGRGNKGRRGAKTAKEAPAFKLELGFQVRTALVWGVRVGLPELCCFCTLLRVLIVVPRRIVVHTIFVAFSNLLACRRHTLQVLESEYIIDWLGKLGRAVAATRN